MTLTGDISIASGIRQRSRDEERALDHPGHFHEYVFGLKLAKFHWEIFELLLEGMREPFGTANPALILAPRDHAKTTNVAESYPLWQVGLDPLLLCQIIGSTSSLARKRIKKIASCIRFNQKFKNLFGELYPDNPDLSWSRDELEVIRDQELVWNEGRAERDPTFIALGITTSVEGGRAGLQVFDDVVTFENCKTQNGRETTSDKFWMSFDPMLLPKGQQLIIGTRYHYADLYSELIAKFDTEGLYTDLYLNEERDSILS
jgi:hypothetical protein|tara:strand:+ start:3118 stop:3897 length:780 start_codon:yes stop_codon:yes gene_type:complete